MKKLSMILGIAMLMLGIFASTAGNSSAAPLQGKDAPGPCLSCVSPGKLAISVRENSSSVIAHPIAGATIMIYSAVQSGLVAKGVSDTNGNFSVTLAPGLYEVTVSASNYGNGSFSSLVYANKASHLTALLDSTAPAPNPLPCVSCGSAR